MVLGSGEWGAEESLGNIPIRNGCTNIMKSATQLARLGYLFLNSGKWKGEQLISESWINEALKNQVPLDISIEMDDRKIDGRGCYGFNWWVKGISGDMTDTPAETKFTSLLRYNVYFIITKWNMIVVRMGTDGNPEEGKRFVYNEFFKALGKAILN